MTPDQRKEKKTYGRLLFLLKLFIAFGALWFIVDKVFRKENTVDVLEECRLLLHDNDRRFSLLAALLLMPVNWGMEAWKWKLVVERLHPIGFFRAFEGVLSGLTVSFFTPNRVGEYAGRIIYLREGSRLRGTLLTVIENIAQLVITVVAGLLALPLYLAGNGEPATYVATIAVGGIGLSFLAVFLFLRMPHLSTLLPRLPLLKRFEPYLHVEDAASPALLWKVLAWSLLRFLVFSFQLYLLLLAFGVQTPYGPAMLRIVLTFFILTLIPTFAFTDLSVRGAAGTYFFATLTSHLTGVVFATVALWLINLALPAALGALLLAVISPKSREAK
jgi:hypothetical protein